MIKKWGKERFQIWCKYSCTISVLVKILFAKLDNFYVQYAWILIIKKQNSNQNVMVEKMVVFVKTFECYHHNSNFRNFFRLSIKTGKEVENKI